MNIFEKIASLPDVYDIRDIYTLLDRTVTPQLEDHEKLTIFRVMNLYLTCRTKLMVFIVCVAIGFFIIGFFAGDLWQYIQESTFVVLYNDEHVYLYTTVRSAQEKDKRLEREVRAFLRQNDLYTMRFVFIPRNDIQVW
jgi:hypothetical protein